MRLAIFTDSYYPYVSGVVNSIAGSVKELRALNHQVYIFAPRYPCSCEDEEGIFRFPSVRPPTNPDYSIAIPFFWGLGRTLRNLKIDLIHVHSPFIMGRVGVTQARRLGVPVVFTYHTLYDQYVHYVPISPEITRRLTVKWTRNFCHCCDRVIVPTPRVKELLRAQGVKAPIEVLPTGVDIKRFGEGDGQKFRRQYRIPASALMLLFVGRLAKEKNVDFLLRAFAYLLKEIVKGEKEIFLVIVARGPEEEHLKELASLLGVRERVIFTGQLVGEDLVNSYHAADLFVFPSVTETQGLVVVEAMAAGLPVVALDAFGVGDLVSHGEDGWLSEPVPEAFAYSTWRLLQEQGRREKMSQAARKKAESLSSPVIARRLEKIYVEVLHEYQQRYYWAQA